MTKFELFIKERRYLKAVSPRTLEWHEQSLKWLGVENPIEDDYKEAVLRMREAGLKPSSVNFFGSHEGAAHYLLCGFDERIHHGSTAPGRCPCS